MSVFSIDFLKAIVFCVIAVSVLMAGYCGQEEEVAEGVAGAAIITNLTPIQNSLHVVDISDEVKVEMGDYWFGHDDDPAEIRALVNEYFADEISAKDKTDITNPLTWDELDDEEAILEPGGRICGIE